MLLVVLYGSETWSLILREKHAPKEFKNMVLRRIFGPKRDEVTGEQRKLHSEEIRNLYLSVKMYLFICSLFYDAFSVTQTI
jgi:hypothetical protein